MTPDSNISFSETDTEHYPTEKCKTKEEEGNTYCIYVPQIEAVGGDKEVENVQRIYTQKKISLRSDE